MDTNEATHALIMENKAEKTKCINDFITWLIEDYFSKRYSLTSDMTKHRTSLYEFIFGKCDTIPHTMPCFFIIRAKFENKQISMQEAYQETIALEGLLIEIAIDIDKFLSNLSESAPTDALLTDGEIDVTYKIEFGARLSVIHQITLRIKELERCLKQFRE